jgi:hypothetical protein
MTPALVYKILPGQISALRIFSGGQDYEALMADRQ